MGSGLQIMKRADFQPPVDGARRPWRSGSEEAGPESDAMAGWLATEVGVLAECEGAHRTSSLSGGVGASGRRMRRVQCALSK